MRQDAREWEGKGKAPRHPRKRGPLPAQPPWGAAWERLEGDIENGSLNGKSNGNGQRRTRDARGKGLPEKQQPNG